MGIVSTKVYDDTSGLTVGDPLAKIDLPLCLGLGPDTLDNFYDGIQRPLERSPKSYKAWLTHGASSS